jgi:arsenic resistance protein ArsH
MKALIFNGSLETKANAVSNVISNYLHEKLTKLNVDSSVFNLADSNVPLLDFTFKETPASVNNMITSFREADVHIWLTPLYHGSMTGAMKNCLDWLEYSAKLPEPYLSGKRIGLVCWADGVQAMQGINAMDSVAKALRAWTLPYSVAMQHAQILNEKTEIDSAIQKRFEPLLQLLIEGPKPTKL